MSEISNSTNSSSLLKTGLAALLASIGASLCCVGPLVLISLGIGGTWISYLTAFEPYRWIFIVFSLVFILLAFRKLYLVPRACLPGTPCADPRTLRRQRVIFWLVTSLLLLLLTFPWYGVILFS